jgi:hypothetical protein
MGEKSDDPASKRASDSFAGVSRSLHRAYDAALYDPQDERAEELIRMLLAVSPHDLASC